MLDENHMADFLCLFSLKSLIEKSRKTFKNHHTTLPNNSGKQHTMAMFIKPLFPAFRLYECSVGGLKIIWSTEFAKTESQRPIYTNDKNLFVDELL